MLSMKTLATLLAICFSLANAGNADWRMRKNNKVTICARNRFRPHKFRTRRIKRKSLPFFLSKGHMEGECSQHCTALCDDNDACTIDDAMGTCEENGCPSSRPRVDCGIGFTCDSTVGCVPDDDLLPQPLVTKALSVAPSNSPTTSFPSVAPSIALSAEPSQSPSNAPTSSAPSSKPSVQPSSPLSTSGGNPLSGCTDNMAVYTVYLDLQVDFQGNSVPMCTSSEWDRIRSTISETLDWEFTTVVADWDGSVSFGSVTLEENEGVNSLRRTLRGSQEPQRLLNACPSQRDTPCGSDVCHWGCLFAVTTSCGVNSMTNWAGLAEGVQVSLADLGHVCLGGSSGLSVDLVVGDGPSNPPST